MLLQCVVYSISQDEIVNHNYMVETDNLPITGLDPDLKVYGYYEEFTPTPIDSRGQILVITKTRIDSPHPNHPDLLTYAVTYATQRKTDEELRLAVDNEEQNANNQLLGVSSLTAINLRRGKLLHKKSKGFSLTTEEEAFMDYYDILADAMDDNADNKDSMYDYIENNPTSIPDFDQGWTTEIV